MKKIITLVLAVMLVACVGMTAFAAEVATPFDDASALNVLMVEDFTDISDISGAFLGYASAVAITDTAFTDCYNFDNGAFGVTKGDQVWAGILDSSFAGANANAEGVGFYIKNTNDAEAAFWFYLLTNEDTTGNINNCGYTIGSNKAYALINAKGKTVVEAPECTHPSDASMVVQSELVIPANFEGYVVIPFASLQKNWATSAYDNSTASLIGFGVMQGVNMSVDNIFFYGANLNGNMEASDLLNELPSDSADISVIAYAATAIVGLGALVIAKKR